MHFFCTQHFEDEVSKCHNDFLRGSTKVSYRIFTYSASS